MEGLDLDKAMAQPETAYKVRHLKMGIMMASVLCTCDSYTSFRMLVRNQHMDSCQAYGGLLSFTHSRFLGPTKGHKFPPRSERKLVVIRKYSTVVFYQWCCLHLQNGGVQKKLIDLYQSQFMSSSVKLQIIRALDSTTRYN